MLVLKLNNPDAISAKVADWYKRFGVNQTFTHLKLGGEPK